MMQWMFLKRCGLLLVACFSAMCILMLTFSAVEAQNYDMPTYEACTEEYCMNVTTKSIRKLLQCCQIYSKCCQIAAVFATCPLSNDTTRTQNYCDPFGPLCANDYHCPLGTICCRNNLAESGTNLKCCYPPPPLTSNLPTTTAP